MNIKRYNIFMDEFENFWDCEESPTGDWIKASDVNKIKADAIREYANSQTSGKNSAWVLAYIEKLEQSE